MGWLRYNYEITDRIYDPIATLPLTCPSFTSGILLTWMKAAVSLMVWKGVLKAGPILLAIVFSALQITGALIVCVTVALSFWTWRLWSTATRSCVRILTTSPPACCSSRGNFSSCSQIGWSYKLAGKCLLSVGIVIQYKAVFHRYKNEKLSTYCGITPFGPLLWYVKQTVSTLCQLQPAT